MKRTVGGPGGACWPLRWRLGCGPAAAARPLRWRSDGRRLPGDSDGRRLPGDSDGRRLPGDSDDRRLPGDSDGRRLPAPTLHRFRSAQDSSIRVSWGPGRPASETPPAACMHAMPLACCSRGPYCPMHPRSCVRCHKRENTKRRAVLASRSRSDYAAAGRPVAAAAVGMITEPAPAMRAMTAAPKWRRFPRTS